MVTLADRARGTVDTRTAAVLIVVQFVGAALGTVIANLMFGLDAVDISAHERSGGGLWLGEVVATFGLVLVILAVARSARPDRMAFAVGGYIAAAYWFTSSTGFANPALTAARTLSDTFTGIAPSSVAAFVGMQLVGGALALATVRFLYPEPAVPAAIFRSP